MRSESQFAGVWAAYVLSIPLVLIVLALIYDRCDSGTCSDMGQLNGVGTFLYHYGFVAYIVLLALFLCVVPTKQSPEE
jgi:hypothetical protein